MALLIPKTNIAIRYMRISMLIRSKLVSILLSAVELEVSKLLIAHYKFPLCEEFHRRLLPTTHRVNCSYF
jgi:hypothetical protein